MGNPRAREFFKQQQLADEWRRAETVARELTDNVSILGIGGRHVQVVHAPSFEQGYSWDILEFEGEYRLFRSQVIEGGLRRKLLDYRQLEADEDLLEQFVKRLQSLRLPIVPELRDRAGFDGTTYQLALFGDFLSEVRFQWWQEGPPHWGEMITIANEMIQSFSALPPKRKT